MSGGTGFPLRTADASSNANCSLRDIHQFGENIRQMRSNLSLLQRLRAEHASANRALRGQMLKGNCHGSSERSYPILNEALVACAAGTKKEEVVRFHRAKTDAEFAMILRERTLGPEHLETQNQLRKDVRVCR